MYTGITLACAPRLAFVGPSISSYSTHYIRQKLCNRRLNALCLGLYTWLPYRLYFKYMSLLRNATMSYKTILSLFYLIFIESVELFSVRYYFAVHLFRLRLLFVARNFRVFLFWDPVSSMPILRCESLTESIFYSS